MGKHSGTRRAIAIIAAVLATLPLPSASFFAPSLSPSASPTFPVPSTSPTPAPSGSPTTLASVVAPGGAAHAWPLDELHCTGCDPAFVEDVGSASPRAHGTLTNDAVRMPTGGATLNQGTDGEGFIAFAPVSMSSGAASICMTVRFDAAGPSFLARKRGHQCRSIHYALKDTPATLDECAELCRSTDLGYDGGKCNFFTCKY